MSVNVFAGQGTQPAPHDPLVTVADFAEWHKLDNSDDSLTPRIQTALEIASEEIRRGRRQFDFIEQEIVLVNGTARPSFLSAASRLPVTAVTSVEQILGWDTDFTLVDPTTYDWDADGIFTMNGRGFIVWTDRRAGIRLTYSHGYANLPRDVAGICLSLAKRLYDDPTQQEVVMEKLGDWQAQYQGTAWLTASEKEALSIYEMALGA